MAKDFFGPFGDALEAADADQLERILFKMDCSFPGGAGERTTESIERSAIVRYLAALLSADRLSFPLRVKKQESPDFKIRMASADFGLEVSEAASEADQQATTRLEDSPEGSMLMASPKHTGRRGKMISDPNARDKRRRVPFWTRDESRQAWVKEIIRAIRKKTERLTTYETFGFTDLLLVDQIFAGGLAPWDINEVSEILAEAICQFQSEDPDAPRYRRYSVVSGRIFLYDVHGAGELLSVPLPDAASHFLPFTRLGVSEEELHRFSRGHHIRKLAFFGSIQEEDGFGPASDVDVLVEFKPSQPVGLIRMAWIEHELSKLLGRKVDLRTVPELSQYFREDVVRRSELIYVDD